MYAINVDLVVGFPALSAVPCLPTKDHEIGNSFLPSSANSLRPLRQNFFSKAESFNDITGIKALTGPMVLDPTGYIHLASGADVPSTFGQRSQRYTYYISAVSCDKPALS